MNPFKSISEHNTKFGQFENSLNESMEHILYLTVSHEMSNANKPKYLFYVKDYNKPVCSDDINQIIFERLFQSNPKDHIITNKLGYNVEYNDVEDVNPFSYLFSSYCRLQNYFKQDSYNSKISLEIKDAICLQSALYLFSCNESNPTQAGVKFYNMISNNCSNSFILEYCSNIMVKLLKLDDINEGDDLSNLMNYLREFFEYFLLKTFLDRPPKNSNLLGFWKDPLQTLYCPERKLFIHILTILVSIPVTAELILDFSIEKLTNGLQVERCLLGRILCSTHLSSGIMQKQEFFNKMPMTVQEKSTEESTIWDMTKTNIMDACDIFMEIFRNSKSRPIIKTKLMNWFGKCLSLNEGRSKLMNALNSLPSTDTQFGSDGFFMNFTCVLFHIGAPLLNVPFDKVLSIQVEFSNDKEASASLLPSLFEETRLGASANSPTTGSDTKYTVLTQLFYLLHKVMRLSFHVVHGRFIQLNQSLHRVQDLFEDLMTNQINNPQSEQLRNVMSGQMSHYMSLGCSMKQPEFSEGCMSLVIGSAQLLVHLAKLEDQNLICSLPEFVMDNIVDWTTFLRHFNDSFFETCNLPLEPLLEMSVLFMGSTKLVKNPHLRSKIPAILECLIPERDAEPTSGSGPLTFYLRERLFLESSYSNIHGKIIESLFCAFTSMELSAGQENVRFEEKFEYRRPMYACLKYFYGQPKYDEQIKKLEQIALTNINDAEAPLCLQFLNLLINDATFLLDEALNYLGQLKNKEQERINQGGKFTNPNTEAEFQHMSMMASYHNSLGSDTVDQLSRMASLCPNIMVHPILVDRIACTLNYFIDHLVGPKRSSLTVRDKETYKFKPKELIQTIARIYVCLGREKEEFCRAVVNDGRSYSDQLLASTSQLVTRISMDTCMSQEFEQLTQKLKDIAVQENEDDENFEDGPDEFYCPIMGTIMKDPVLLPSSGVIVDRKTIFRHLLSDPTDPFNRQPLAMTEVATNEELKKKIHEFIAERRAQSKNN